MTMSTAELIRKATGAIGTGDFIGDTGLLQPETANAFLDQVFEATAFNEASRQVRRRSKSGSISKIGIGSRMLRRKTAGVDDATLVKPTFADVPYQTVNSRLDWEIEEEVFQENIEQEGFEDHLARLMTTAIGVDLEDLHFNGDTADTSVDAPFLTQNDGWLKQIAAGASHRVNGALVAAGVPTKAHFFDLYAAVPNKYKRAGRLRWIGNPAVFAAYIEGLTERATAAGDAILLGGWDGAKPLGIDRLEVPAMPTNRLLLADPQNFATVVTREIRRRKTTEGREAIRQDKRFYAIFLDDDPIIEEMDAIGDMYGLVA